MKKAPCINLEGVKRILVVNPFGIGDVLFSTPLIRNLRYFFPTNYIAYLCNKRTAYILENNPYIDEVFVFEKDDWRTLWGTSKIRFLKEFYSFLKRMKMRNFDLCIDLSLNSQYGFYLKNLKIPLRVGFNFKKRGRFLTHSIDIEGYEGKHIVEHYLDIIRFLNIEIKDTNLDFYLNLQDERWAQDFWRKEFSPDDVIVGVCPAGGESWGSQSSLKHWEVEKFASLIERINKELQAKIILFSSSKERRISNQIKYLLEDTPLVDLSGKTSLGQFAALIKKCNLFLSNDGGPIHIAVSLGVSTVSIFGPVDEKVYGPYPSSEKHIVIKKDFPCRPCYKKFKLPSCPYFRRCLTSIGVNDVFGAVKELLGRQKEQYT